MKLVMGSNTITVCTSFLIFVLMTSIIAFPASQNNGFLATASAKARLFDGGQR